MVENTQKYFDEFFLADNQRTNKNMVGSYPLFVNVCRTQQKNVSVSQNC